MTEPRSEAPGSETRSVIHLLVADLTRTACRLPASPNLNTTTMADHATCRECLLNAGR